jgi:hypothetical protein
MPLCLQCLGNGKRRKDMTASAASSKADIFLGIIM